MAEARVRFDPSPARHQRLGELRYLLRGDALDTDIRCRTEHML